ncbi:ERG4/ERG24 ergosterol biosynthesis protein [Pterulicium gracile]|uniref:Delta(14)-sterol reductase ERG24 n=1 Tax=Pterulicium gracile TaxID=1884261 RepID=A0A5C3QZI7_9AGAR|nr:ERG4/ERG24 ergosterol biosynthesis protein [Pterula gracilis]
MSSQVTKHAALNPKTTHFEFFGPPGALAVTLGVPFLSYALNLGCSERLAACPPPLKFIPGFLLATVEDSNWWSSLWDTKVVLVYAGWYAFCVAAWAVLPGDYVEGLPLRTGGTKKYKINAFSTFLLALGLVFGWIIRFGPESFTYIYEKFPQFITAALLNSILQAAFVYAKSFNNGELLALGGNSGNFIYDFYIGRALNPSIGSFDIKSFNELRPGLILWALIDISMVCEQAVRRGGFTRVTDSLWLVVGSQIWYVADALYNEPAIFTTMDITTDGFGFMLSVGDLLWVPFIYSLQARYLVFNQVELGPIYTAAIMGFNLLGYYIFRAANGEKNDFRNGRDKKNLHYMTTEGGRKLITSGWWGRSRHPNYLGDIIMATAWCLPTGFNTIVTYFYPIYFAVLLVHRQMRDDEQCAIKYGKDWDKYKKIVPWRIIPYVY